MTYERLVITESWQILNIIGTITDIAFGIFVCKYCTFTEHVTLTLWKIILKYSDFPKGIIHSKRVRWWSRFTTDRQAVVGRGQTRTCFVQSSEYLAFFCSFWKIWISFQCSWYYIYKFCLKCILAMSRGNIMASNKYWNAS